MSNTTDTAAATPKPTLWTALAAAQAEFPEVEKTGHNKHINRRYASLDDIRRAWMPVLGKHGIAVTQHATPAAEGNRLIIHTTLRLGDERETFESSVPMEKGNKPIQGYGATVTYGCRYALTALLQVASGDDTDGETEPAPPERAAPPPLWSHAQRDRWYAMCADLKLDAHVVADRLMRNQQWRRHPGRLSEAEREQVAGMLLAQRQRQKQEAIALQGRFFPMWEEVAGGKESERRRAFTDSCFGFYHYSDATRDQLHKLSELVEKGSQALAEALVAFEEAEAEGVEG